MSSYRKTLFIFILTTIINTAFGQSDSLRLKHEFAFTVSASLDKNEIKKYNQAALSSPEVAYFNIQYRLRFFNKQRISASLALGAEFNSITQSVTYTNPSNDIKSSHSPTNSIIAIYAAPVFTYNVLKTDNISYGIDLLPGTQINLYSINEPASISSDYQDPNGGDEIGRFEIKNTNIISPSIQFNLWCLIPLDSQTIKPFVGLKLSKYQVSSSLHLENGTISNHPDYYIHNFLNIGLSLRL
jgi:hypothetical protein